MVIYLKTYLTMIKETYWSFEVAKLLKEKGFNDYVRQYYVFDYKFNIAEFVHDDREDNPNEFGSDYYAAPTQQMAMARLRKVHQIAIVIDCWFGGERYISWHGKIMCYGDDLKTQQDVELPYLATYEEAVEAAIKYCLTNLI